MASPLNASGWWMDWLGEEVGRLNASWVDVMALRFELRVFLEEKRLASQLMVDVGGQDSKRESGGGERGK